MRKVLAGIRHWIKEMLLAFSLLLAAPEIAERFAGLEGFGAQAVYLGLLAIMWAGLIAAAYVPSGWLRWPIALIAAASAYFSDVFARVTTQVLTYDAFINMRHSAAFAGDAVAQNQSAMLAASLPALVLLAAIGTGPKRRLRLPRPLQAGRPLPGWLLACAPLLATGLLTGMLFLRGGEGSRGLPHSYPPLAYLALYEYEAIAGSLGPRHPVTLAQGPLRPGGKIVLVIDESIAAQYLDINSPSGVPTPLSRPWPGVTITNFGVAASITNCSVGTNVTLRYGGTRAEYQRYNAVMPSIWAYARKAGMRTVYIDAQRTGGMLQNQMTDDERAQIDEFIQFDGVAVEQRDMAAADELIRQLARPGPAFILINKVGAHFPVHDKYPDAFMRYRPVLPRGAFTDISDTGERKGFGGTPEDWRRYRNSYRNTLLWNVGEFFERVLTRGDLSNAALIYTADHGQELHQRGQQGLYTHCTPEPSPDQGAVPLVVLQGAKFAGSDWATNLTQNRNHSSHYMIFPSLLGLMGYSPGAVEQTYGRAMWQAANDPGSFNTLFNARLNRKPQWLRIDPQKLAQPPASDFTQTR